MSDVEQTPMDPMEIIKQLSKKITPRNGTPPGIKNFTEKSRELYTNMEAQINYTDDKKSICDQLLELAEIIYTTEKTACIFERNYSTDTRSISNRESSFYCGQNVKRILDSIKRFKDNGIKIEQYNDNQRIAIMKAITRQYSCDDVEEKVEGKIKLIRQCTDADVPEVVNALKILRNEREPYFQEQCKELVEFKEVPSNGSNKRKYTILLHSGFQKRVFKFRPGPSPISSDTDGVFICRLRKAIIKFLDDYNISYEKSDRFDNFDEACDKACDEANRPDIDLQTSSQSSHNPDNAYTVLPEARQPGSLMLTGPDYYKYLDLSKQATASLAIGGRLSRRRKAYKTTRRNNKYKNKKHYIKKRHTKRCKKSHRRRISPR